MNSASLLLTDIEMADFANGIDKSGLKAYPNPFINFFTLTLPGTSCTVKITDMTGKVLLTQNTSSATLQLGQNLKAGMYRIEVWQEKEKLYRAAAVLKQ